MKKLWTTLAAVATVATLGAALGSALADSPSGGPRQTGNVGTPVPSVSIDPRTQQTGSAVAPAAVPTTAPGHDQNGTDPHTGTPHDPNAAGAQPTTPSPTTTSQPPPAASPTGPNGHDTDHQQGYVDDHQPGHMDDDPWGYTDDHRSEGYDDC